MTFVSKATMETFEGHTDQVTGTVAFVRPPSPTAPGSTSRWTWPASIPGSSSGTAKCGKITSRPTGTPRIFEGGRILEPSAGALGAGTAVTFALAGSPPCTGSPVRWRFRSGSPGTVDGKDVLHVTTSFTLALSDYGIDRPQFLVLKLSDRQEIRLDLTAVAGP